MVAELSVLRHEVAVRVARSAAVLSWPDRAKPAALIHALPPLWPHRIVALTALMSLHRGWSAGIGPTGVGTAPADQR
jgi:hypothetical protein